MTKTFKQIVCSEYRRQLNKINGQTFRRRFYRQLARKPNKQLNLDRFLDVNSKQKIQMKFLNNKYVLKRSENIKPLEAYPTGQQLDQIITTVVIGGQLCHLVKWKGCSKCDLVVNTVLNQQHPQHVIEYYQKNFKFLHQIIT